MDIVIMKCDHGPCYVMFYTQELTCPACGSLGMVVTSKLTEIDLVNAYNSIYDISSPNTRTTL